MARVKTYNDAINREPDHATVRRLAENCPRELLEEGISEATKALAGPMSNAERAMLVMERKELRAALALHGKRPPEETKD